eukprot:5238166-Pyramimonas_sp.AAC.1
MTAASRVSCSSGGAASSDCSPLSAPGLTRVVVPLVGHPMCRAHLSIGLRAERPWPPVEHDGPFTI